MNYIIITGASKGLGKALAENMMDENNHLFCISRTVNEELVEKARENCTNLDYIKYDLNNVTGIEGLIDDIFSKIDGKNVESIYLINNVGIVTPVKPVEKCSADEIISNVNINLMAPMIMTSAFIRKTKDLEAKKRIINISSGAGKRPIFGWGPYCTSKAGLDLFTRCVGLEQEENNYPIEILSFGPGIMDTDLQREVRSSKKEDFVQLDDFIGFKENGKLATPESVANIIIDLLEKDEFQQGGVVDVSDFR
ncbi:(S)-benzoin forming benzil reductase [Dethiothermospora halolimnae]|uniref:(S)-benzoin forming benzil reductase n=1 Tax=Dethiothermospora halolimnae TaxID=3114390 RepID=UPI003CCB987C